MPDSTLFFQHLPHPEQDHSTLLWQFQGIWLVTQAARWGQIPEIFR